MSTRQNEGISEGHLTKRGYEQKRSQKLVFIITAVAIAALIIVAVIFGYRALPSEVATILKPAMTNDELLVRVTSLVALPSGEVPVVVSVKDIAPVDGSPYFLNASLDDKALIYCGAKRSILYGVTEDKVLEVIDAVPAGHCSEPEGESVTELEGEFMQ